MGLWYEVLSKIQFSYTLVQENKFCDFGEGACHYDITETKPFGCWYLIWYQFLEEALSYWSKNKITRGLF